MAGGRQLTVTLVANTKSFGRGMADAVRSAEGFKGKMSAIGSSLSMVAGPALLAAGAAAGAFAIKLGVDGVQAAMDEQKQLAVLKQTLDNVGQGFAMDEVNQFVDNLRFATGIADDELRPAFESIVRVTKDAASAQDLLTAAVDASVATGKDLSTVSAAVAKAVGGQTTALKKLIPGLDVTKIKAGDTASVIAALEDKFGGSAAAAAGTFAGQLQRLQDGFNELTESFGHGFLNAMDNGEQTMSGMAQALRDLQPAAESLGQSIGTLAKTIADNKATIDYFTFSLKVQVEMLQFASNLVTGVAGMIGGWVDNIWPFNDATDQTTKSVQDLSDMSDDLIVKGKQLVQSQAQVSDEYSRGYVTLDEYAAGAGRATDAMSLLRDEVNRTTVSLGPLAAAFDEANAAMDRRQAMQDYRDALKAYIADPTQQTMDAVESAAIAAGQSFDDPKKQAKFMGQAVDEVTRAAENAGQKVPKEFQNIGDAAATQLDPIAKVKQAMETIPTDIQTKIAMNVTVNGKYYDPYGAYKTATGGPVYATGGMVRAALGTHASDNVPAMLSRGEYVLNADTVRRLGVGTLNGLNNGGSMGAGLTINGGITVQSAAGERAEESVPRALRRLAFVAGLNG